MDVTLPRIIQDYGSLDSKLVLIGEAPGQHEDERGEPFVGPSGFLLGQWWEPLGLRREQFYITNVVRWRPPNNEIWAVGKDAIRQASQELHGRLAQLTDPYVIIPTGDIALNALMRTDYGERMRISDWRGSILSYTDAQGRRIKVIPTIHPAATFRQPILSKFCKADWKRIADDSQFRDLRLPERQLIIDPNNEQVEWFKQQAQAEVHICKNGIPSVMAVDVENSMNGDYFKELTCVGFSIRPHMSLTISVLRSDYGNDMAYRYAWDSVRALCELPIAKVLQNGLTDLFKLKYYGIELANYQWDLMEMDHALDPNDGGDTEKGSEEAYRDKTFKMEMRSLKVLQSVYSRQPFHKLMGKSFDRTVQLRYNGLDCCVEREIFDPMWVKLHERGLV